VNPVIHLAVAPPSRGIWGDSETWGATEATNHASKDVGGEVETLRASGLVDTEWYMRNHPDVAGQDAVAHFHTIGWRENRQPNPCFDTAWYLAQNPNVGRAGIDPLLHYIRSGERLGFPPSQAFDLEWYAMQNQVGGGTCLAHYLARRQDGRTSPVPEFDPAYYLATYPDIAAAGVDPFEHYMNWGYKERRNPSAGFDTGFYMRRYLKAGSEQNPVLHYRSLRGLADLRTCPSDEDAGVFVAADAFQRSGALFEEVAPLPDAARRLAMVLAYYLPQYHRIAENDEWWGTGFTEWTALPRGMPRFAGHYQPRTPRDLGHYSLADAASMRAQASMARAGGVHGFVHYFYWFNGRRLLQGPTEAMLVDPTIDMSFCLMWANENWTRRWDGADQDVLISQDYRTEDEVALVDCFARHFRDKRHIRVGGRPLLMVYRPGLIPDPPATIARWRRLFEERHGENPLMVMSQSFGAEAPAVFGFDGAIEFPPHKLVVGLALRNAELAYFDPRASGQVYAYDDVVTASLDAPDPGFPLIKTAVPSWDNDARRQGKGMVLHGSTPAKYQAWLSALIAGAVAKPFFGQPLVCINAWNEWAEGAYLEPDVHFGGAYLNATARAVAGTAAVRRHGLLLVGHDAFPAGAQMLLLNLARVLTRVHGVRLEVLLLGGGALRAEYARLAPTAVLPDPGRLAEWLEGAAGRGLGAAIVNTAASAWALPELVRAGMAPTLLVHEMGRLIAEKGLLEGLRRGLPSASRVVFASRAGHDAVAALVEVPAGQVVIAPQGQYRGVAFSARARGRMRAALGVPATGVLVLGVGYADMRKGFDLFLHTWRAARRQDPTCVFCWVGKIEPMLLAYLQVELDAAEATASFIRTGHQPEVADYYSAADVLALTSREDPFPSVVLEAISAGLGCVAFEGSGGIPGMLRTHQAGAAVAMGDTEAMASSLLTIGAAGAGARARLAGLARQHFDFSSYVATLLRAAMPDLADISVVVPSYNYARYLPTRLNSVFAQTHPVREVIVLDDASSDGSAALAAKLAAANGRDIVLKAGRQNSGSVFRQWERGAKLAGGEYVWIAEADDDAEPHLLEALAARLEMAPNIDMVLCDSRAIDGDGRALQASYQDYYAASDAGCLAHDGLFMARDFARRFLVERNLILNASAVLWRRSALLAALATCADDLTLYRMAGDWRLYLALMLASPGQVAWVAEPLNIHRRHAASVTGGLAAAEHVDEIRRIHVVARAALGLDGATTARQDAYRAEVEGMLTRA
jgi:glycosyltransferase involved in cell wall biosynthesis